MVALTSRLQHEFNYTDEVLSKKKLKRLNIDPRNIAIKWTMDYCAQALRAKQNLSSAGISRTRQGVQVPDAGSSTA